MSGATTDSLDTEARTLLVEAVATQSLSGSEDELAALLTTFARDRGAKAWVDEAGNAHVRTGSRTVRPVMMVSHLDTVGGAAPFEVTDAFVAGRGSVDAKGALVAMLIATLRLQGSGLSLHWVGAVGEETMESPGAEHLRASCEPPAALIIGEPSGSAKVTIGYKGKADFVYEVAVPDAHTATPHDKASEHAVLFLAALNEIYSAAGNAQFESVGLTVRNGSLEPEIATCTLSFRVPPGLSITDLHVELTALAGPQATIELLHSVEPVIVPRTDIVVANLSTAIAGRGLRPRHVLKTGTSDMNTLARSWSVPMATYGPGDSRLDHSANEHLFFDEFELSVRVLQEALTPICAATGAMWKEL